eukprot:5405871-Prymnesium_polylepis.1
MLWAWSAACTGGAAFLSMLAAYFGDVPLTLEAPPANEPPLEDADSLIDWLPIVASLLALVGAAYRAPQFESSE